jgi:hypothetical protein
MGTSAKQRQQIADLIGVGENGHPSGRISPFEMLDFSRSEAQIIAGIHDQQETLILGQGERDLLALACRGNDAEIRVVQD